MYINNVYICIILHHTYNFQELGPGPPPGLPMDPLTQTSLVFHYTPGPYHCILDKSLCDVNKVIRPIRTASS